MQTHIHATIPADCLPLVTELITRLGGSMSEAGNDACPSTPIPETERGGRMLRALRQRAGITQKALADAIGIPQSHISEFETDRRAVPYKHARKLAEVLHSIPSHFMKPNAESLAAMRETAEDEGKTYASPQALYDDLGI